MESTNLFGQAISDIFAQHDSLLTNTQKRAAEKRGAKKTELELALVVILVDLASCDQNFDSEEFQVISRGMRRVFGTQKTDILELIQRAQGVISNLRGTASFAQLLRDNTSSTQKELIAQLIEEVIAADGVEDGFETYLRAKYYEILGIPLPPKASQVPDTKTN